MDVNGHRSVHILDFVSVVGMFGSAAAALSTQPQAPEPLTVVEVQQWLTDAKARNEVGETAASEVYFYHLSAGRFGLSAPHRTITPLHAKR